jgi:hypothetical protein
VARETRAGATATLTRDMSQRRTLVALLIAALAAMAVGAMALPAGASVAPGDQSASGASQTAFTTTLARTDGLAARLTGDERREAAGSQRSAKQRLVSLAIVTVVLMIAAFGRRRAAAVAPEARADTSWWSPRSGRAPPPLQLTIA